MPNARAPRKPSPAPPRKKRAPKAGRLQEAEGGKLRALLASPQAKAAGWLLIALSGTLGIAFFFLLVGYGRSKGTGTGYVELDWPEGAGAEDAATLLADKGLAESREGMALFLRASGGTGDFAAGPHLLPQGASPWELRRLLSRSMFRPNAKVTVPEGFHRFDIGARLEKLHVCSKRAFLAATVDPALMAELGVPRPAESVEGFLFPATYDLGLDSDPKEIVRRLVSESNKRWETLAASRKEGLAKLQEKLGWGRREVVTLASIVEKEAAVDDERPVIASVFLNRLTDPEFKSHKLQSDPTAVYGCLTAPEEASACGDFNGKVTPAMNRDPKNRWSTYTHAGLTPGPIANPGARSLDAVLAPSQTRFFYFVASGGGRHTFSESFDAHNEAIQKGRSP